MQKHFIGLDIGSISTKGVIIDAGGQIIADEYIYTEGNPIAAVKTVLCSLRNRAPNARIFGIGTTGSARKLAGAMLKTKVVKNEITAHALGTLSIFPDTRTIFEIGGQDSKIIIIDDGIVTDYAMNTLCAAGTGSFLSSQAKRLGIDIDEFGDIAVTSTSPVSIAARCTVFAESDLVHKAQVGYAKQDIVAGLCMAVATNFFNNLAKGKRIVAPIVFQGGVSRNIGVVKAFEKLLGQPILVDSRAHLMGALGMALLSREQPSLLPFDYELVQSHFATKGAVCNRCANNCELVSFFCDDELVDVWGRRCGE